MTGIFVVCFNSLRAGRDIQTRQDLRTDHPNKSFNSLRAGRDIQTGKQPEDLSLPIINRFNSLRAGRDIQTDNALGKFIFGIYVSIPYEREGTFRR